MEFTLRPLEPSDGPALDELMRSEAMTTTTPITTHYRYDVHASLLALHPGLFGVVATAPGHDGLVGMATAFIDEVQVEGGLYPCAHFENLKVRHDVRRQGLGRRLAEWRIAEARRRFGSDGVIVAGVEATNGASLATARTWARQILGPLRIVIASTRSRTPALDGLEVRPIEPGDVDAVVAGSNAFYESSNLYPRLTAASLQALLAPIDPGGAVRQYRVALSPSGEAVAGALVHQRYELMTDHVERLPTPLALANKVVRILPADGVIKTAEVSLAWFAPGMLAAGRQLWEWIRHEWHGRATTVGGVIDPRSDAAAMCRVRPSLAPRLRLMVPVHAPVPLSEDRPLCMWR